MKILIIKLIISFLTAFAVTTLDFYIQYDMINISDVFSSIVGLFYFISFACVTYYTAKILIELEL